MTERTRRVSVVTGAADGIGRAVAEALAAVGDTVCLLDVDEEGGLEVSRGLEDAELIRCDVTSESDVAAAADRIGRAHGRVDVLVNNAGGFPTALRLEEVSLADWRATVELNLTSVFLVSQALLPLLRRSSSPRIINIGSLAGQTAGWTTSPPYAASKAGVHALTRVMASELAREGFTVNALAPTAVLTDRVRRLRGEEEMRATAEAIPLARYQTPDEVAAWVVFLASPEAGYMTGQTLSVNGGRFMA
ncbi:MAG TPA: SDR family NAD(P)-dependent oxidoreductase [Acidimicrobiia bacterium]|jgi:NAD(P)-dependent dehydrogenase (short-subunit alcohol dehydrogenase family)|nr:SDR family NAD(P)-dependent oxidoreductase [Acidimicrobiia bacterium]